MFAKVFTSMYDGTLATRGPWQALVTFQQFLVLADRVGIVDMTAEAIARRTTIPLDIIKIGITSLEQTDDGSRTPDEEGRRIVRIRPNTDWGWQVVNYEKYRNMRNADERREYMRNLMRERRSATKKHVNGSKHVLAKLAYEMRSDADEKQKKETTTRAKTARGCVLPDGFELTPETLAWCKPKMGEKELSIRYHYFVDYAKSSGKRYLDWQAAFKNSVRGDWAKVPSAVKNEGRFPI
jgi:hypothetical protein